VALVIESAANSDIWIWDLVHKILTRLTFEGTNSSPLWTPDGKRIAFMSYREGKYHIYWKSADGAGKDELLGSAPAGATIPASWSDNGKTMVFSEFNPRSTGYCIGVLSMEGDRKFKSLIKSEKYHDSQPQISPDGGWLVYASDESGRNQIYVRPFPEVNSGRWQISTSGGDSPLWSPDGREIFYRNDDAVMAVSIKTAPSFSIETPRILFRGTYDSNTLSAPSPWDISPDGKRFLMLTQTAEDEKSTAEAPRKIVVVLNWMEELKQRVPLD
jgi:Tol biopolymer transport system component